MPRKFAQKYIVEDTTDGVLRFYFRRKGQPKVRLEGVPGTEEFNRTYYEALNGTMAKPSKDGPSMPTANTLRWLCVKYFESAEFKRLDARTGHVRRQILDACFLEPVKADSDKVFGDMPLAAVTSKNIRVLRDRKADLPESANGRVKALRQVFKWATDPTVELAQTNPARDVGYFKSKGEGFHTWSDAEVEQFEQRHPIGTKARLALTLLLYTLQRRGDVVKFGKQHVRNGWLVFTQQKNRNNKPVRLEIPVHPDLQDVINRSPCGDLTFLVTAFGKGFTDNGFGNWFRDRCNDAGLPHCTAHGLRKAGSTRLANSGASAHQIKAMTGHQTLKEVSRYTAAADQKRLAQQAVDLLVERSDDAQIENKSVQKNKAV